MGLFIQQNDNRSELQQRLAAELREKARLRANGAEPLDQTKKSNYLKNTETAGERGWFWLAILLVALIAGVIVYFYMVTVS